MTSLAEQGMAVAASHADPNDLRQIRRNVETLAATRIPFTAEDCTAMLTDAERERMAAFPNAMGGVFFQLQREGLIESRNAIRAQRKEARGRWLTLWVGAW